MSKNDKKKKDKKSTDDETTIFNHIQKETWQGILAILFFVLTVFFVLSSPDIFAVLAKPAWRVSLVSKFFLFFSARATTCCRFCF